MNLRRGFFRLWVFVGLCWVGAWGWLLRDDFHVNRWEVPWKLIAPQFSDISTEEFERLSGSQLEKYLAQKNAAMARGLYCPHGTPSDNDNRPLDEWSIEELQCARADIIVQNWKDHLKAASIVLFPPLGLFIFGYLITWVFRGFAPSPKYNQKH